MARRYAMGWQRDLPDHRDYSDSTDEIKNLLKGSKAIKEGQRLPKTVDVSQYFPPIEDQLSLGSCTAQAGVGLLEYFENRAHGTYVDASRLFLYKATRNLLGWTGDTGAWLRTTMKAMVLFGAPPERYWPYDIANFDDEPTAFCYSFAQNYKAIKYFRLDPAGQGGADTLARVKRFLSAGYPSMFGFSVYSFGNEDGEFPFPGPDDVQQGGHAVIACGYDDNRVVGNDRGALKIRNSWGTGWGKNGYGWLPYRYVEEQLADDFWSLISADYVNTGNFK